MAESAGRSNAFAEACASTDVDATACAGLSPLLESLAVQPNPTDLGGMLARINELTFSSDRARAEIRTPVVTLHAAQGSLQDARNAEDEMTKAAERLNAALKDFASAVNAHRQFCSKQ